MGSLCIPPRVLQPHSRVNGIQIQRAAHAIGQQVKLLLAVLLHRDEGGTVRRNALAPAEQGHQLLGELPGIKQAVQVGAKHIVLHAALGCAVCQCAEGHTLHLGAAGVDLISGQGRTRKGGGGHGGSVLGAVLLAGKDRAGGQQPQPPHGLRRTALRALRVGQRLAQHLIPAADPQHRRAALGQRYYLVDQRVALADGAPMRTGKQADLYETIRLGMERTVREALQSKGLAKSQITILDALLKLRQVCCHPQLVPLDAAKKVNASAKLDQLMTLLPEMLAEGRRILLFSQFTSMLTLIEAELKKRKLPWVKLTGQSQRRDAIIEQFTSGQVPLFLISLKAGGVGLNLPQADTVIHYDPWWNPAVEAQATDRAHRIGQTQSVWVIKLVAQGTIEERILVLQERKAQLASSLYDTSAGRKEPLFTESDLDELLKPLSLS